MCKAKQKSVNGWTKMYGSSDKWANCLLQRSTRDIGISGYNFSSVQNIWTNDWWWVEWLKEESNCLLVDSFQHGALVLLALISKALMAGSLRKQYCDTRLNSISWCGCQLSLIWKFLTLSSGKGKIISLVNTASSGKETDTYDPLSTIALKMFSPSAPLIVSLWIVQPASSSSSPSDSLSGLSAHPTKNDPVPDRPPSQEPRENWKMNFWSRDQIHVFFTWSSLKLIFMIYTSNLYN